jgi:septal ring factor EnvC (AmiA/AmiB activator)
MTRTAPRKVRWLALFVALFACFAAVALPASASDPEDRLDRLRDKREEVGRRLRSTKQRGESLDSRIARLDVEAEEIQAEVSALDADIAALDDRIASAQARLVEAQQRLAVLSEDLTRIERRLAESTEQFARRAVEIYKAGPTAPLSGLVGSESFSDLVDRYEYYESALDADAQLLDQIEVLRSATLDRRTEVEEEENRIAAAKLQLEQDRAEIAQARAERAGVLEAQRTLIAQKEEVLRGVLARENRLADVADELERDSERVEDLLAARAARRAAARAAARAAERAAERAAARAAARQAAQPSPPTTSTASAGSGGSAPSGGGSTSAPTTGGQLTWPASGPVISGFGYRTHPIFGDTRLHSGIDIAAPYGASVWAADDGVVAFAGTMSGYGNAVVVDHGGGLATTYNHLSAYRVGTGQRVARGQPIANMGCTGYCTGPHLHFEVRVNGTPVDPMPYLQ